MATKIICSAADCKWCNSNHVCTAKTVTLSWHSVVTLNDGRQEFNKCKMYELDESTKELYDKVRKYMEQLGRKP